MTVSSGQTYLAIPGPSVIPEEVLRSMHRAAPNIYEGELIEITESLIPDLNYVARSSGYVAMYIANGHGIWEAARCIDRRTSSGITDGPGIAKYA